MSDSALINDEDKLNSVILRWKSPAGSQEDLNVMRPLDVIWPRPVATSCQSEEAVA